MNTPTQAFEAIQNSLSQYPFVSVGKMMRSDGLKVKDKVVLFFWQDTLILKLGRDYDLTAFGISEIKYLSPFKNKPPMYDWLVISAEFIDQWKILAKEALRIAGVDVAL